LQHAELLGIISEAGRPYVAGHQRAFSTAPPPIASPAESPYDQRGPKQDADAEEQPRANAKARVETDQPDIDTTSQAARHREANGIVHKKVAGVETSAGIIIVGKRAVDPGDTFPPASGLLVGRRGVEDKQAR